MLSNWLDENDDPGLEFRELAKLLIDPAAEYAGRQHTMLDFYRQRVFGRIEMPAEE